MLELRLRLALAQGVVLKKHGGLSSGLASGRRGLGAHRMGQAIFPLSVLTDRRSPMRYLLISGTLLACIGLGGCGALLAGAAGGAVAGAVIERNRYEPAPYYYPPGYYGRHWHRRGWY